MYNPGMEQHHQARRQSHCVPTSPLQRPGQVGHGGRNPAHRILLRGNACTYDTRCCGKRCVHCSGMVDDRAMSACGARSSGPGIPLPALYAVARLQLQLNSRLANLVIGMHRANQHFSGESVTLPWLTQSVLVQVRVRPRTSTWHSLACPLFELPAHPCSWLEYSLQLA